MVQDTHTATYHFKTCVLLHYITCHLADAFIHSDLQLIRLSRRHTPWSNVGLRALLKGLTAVQILSWPQQGSNHLPCGFKSSSLTTTLQAAFILSCMSSKSAWQRFDVQSRIACGMYRWRLNNGQNQQYWKPWHIFLDASCCPITGDSLVWYAVVTHQILESARFRATSLLAEFSSHTSCHLAQGKRVNIFIGNRYKATAQFWVCTHRHPRKHHWPLYLHQEKTNWKAGWHL